MANRRGRPGRAYEPKPLDTIDLHILTELQRDGRASLAELGRRNPVPSPQAPDPTNDLAAPPDRHRKSLHKTPLCG